MEHREISDLMLALSDIEGIAKRLSETTLEGEALKDLIRNFSKALKNRVCASELNVHRLEAKLDMARKMVADNP